MVKFITRTICIALVAVLCVGSANAQLVKTRTEAPKATFSAASKVQVVTKIAPAPKGMVNVTLAAGDVWGDGSGYQMVLDADATEFGVTIPATGALYPNCSAPATLYDVFEYKIPENADPVCNTSNIVINNEITIQIPAGTYDYCVVNPTPGDRLWIAAGDNGRKDNYVFEDGKKYTFTVALAGQNDNVTILVENDDPGDPCPEAKNVKAEVQGTDVIVTWDAAEGTPTGYKVYDGNTELGTTQDLFYVARNLANGEHKLAVAAQYSDGCTPKKVEVTVTIKKGNPVTELDGTCTDGNLSLTWKAPEVPEPPSEVLLQHCEDAISDGIGTGGAATFECIHRWDPSQLAEVGVETGMMLTKITFVPYQSSATFTLKIYQGGTWPSSPGTLISSQTLTTSSLTLENWNEITLDAAVEIDASQELWFGYECAATSGHPAGCDPGPRQATYGDCMLFNGSWQTMNDAGGGSLPYNWCVRGLAASDGKTIVLGESAKATVSKYVVYKDDVKLGESTTTSFEKSEMEGKSDYCVVAVYDDGAQSEKVCKELECGDAPVPCNPPTNVQAAINTETCEVTLTWEWDGEGEGTFKVTKDGVAVSGTHNSPYTTTIESGAPVEFCVVRVCPDGDLDPVCATAVECPKGINDLKGSVNIYPNPATSVVTINGKDVAKVEVYNVVGQMVEMKTGEVKTIDVSTYNNGIYLFRVYDSNNNVVTKRIMVTK